MTPRLNPDRSFRAACLHLFRYVHDAAELRRTPLVAQRFRDVQDTPDAVASSAVVLAGIHQFIRMAADDCRVSEIAKGRADLGERYYAIVLECALGSTPVNTLARRLGISVRHLYRDRDAVYRRLGEALSRSPVEPNPQITVNVDQAALMVAQAQFFIDNARYTMALETLEKIASSGFDGSRRVEALCLAAEIASQQGRFADAFGVLDRARAIRQQTLADEGVPAIVSEAQIAMTAAIAGDDSGKATEAEIQWRRALASLRAQSIGGDRIKALVARALALHARRLSYDGNTAAAFSELKSARIFCEAIATPSTALLTEELMALVWTLFCTRNVDFAKMNELLSTGLLRAQRNGRAKLVLEIAKTMALHEAYMGGQYVAAQSRMRDCVELAVQLGEPTILASTCIDAANLAIGCKDFRAAGEFIAKTNPASILPGLDRAQFYRVNAEISLNRRQYAEALEYAQTSESLADRLNNLRLKGSALNVMAETYDAMGRDADALHRVGQSISLLESWGDPTQLSRAYRLSAKLTGNRTHANRAKAIGRFV
jgi:tetratricopeptide (TPR) repeat protein